MEAGTTLIDEELPARPGGPRPIRRWGRGRIAALVVAGSALLLVGFVQAKGTIDRLHDEIGEARAAEHRLTSRLASLEQRHASLERQAAAAFDPAAIVGTSRPSVFTLTAGPWQGSAFVLSSSDRVSRLVTNFHVVRSSWNAGVRVVVVRNDRSSLSGRIVAVDPDADLATIAVPGSLPTLRPDPGRLEAGEPVVVMGSPFGYGGTVSTGVVSAIRRRYVQFSAPVSPGSSGGPVLDGQGRVIGVAAAKVGGHGAEGLSFAIPIGRVCRLTVAC
jgi:S1-C subfamily serine protease